MPTQVIVFIEADPPRAAAAENLRVRVWSTVGDLVLDRAVPASDTARVPLSPSLEDGSRSYRLVAELVGADGCVVGRVLADGTYASGERRSLRLRFDEACAGVVCPNDQACFEGECRGTCFPTQPFEDSTRSVPQACGPRDAGTPSSLGIQNVAALDEGGGVVAFSWTLDRPGTGQTEYGDSFSYGNLSILEPNLLTRHNQRLRVPLELNRAYHYRVFSADATGNVTHSLERCFRLE